MSKKGFSRYFTPKVLICGLLLGSLAAGGGAYLYSKRKAYSQQESSFRNYSSKYLKSSILKAFFSKLKKNPNFKEQYLKELGPLTPEELNEGYLTAVRSFQYDLAIDFYQLGATDCYQDGEDILLIAMYSGNLSLVEDLLFPKYPLKLYHLSAVRSLVTIDQSNWAYIYKKQDLDDLGFQKYLLRSQKIAEQLLSHYKAQNPVKLMEYDSYSQHEEHYVQLYGANCREDFKKLVEQTLAGKYTLEPSLHGTQHTPRLMNEEGKPVGILKTKNELLAEAFDYEHFAGVPPSIEVNIPEMGDIVVQKWIQNSTMVIESKGKVDLNPEQLHRIRILDIRLGNSDRNRGNVLIAEKEGLKHIVPIDHDLIMHYIPNDNNWEAPYLNAPFSPTSLKYIESLDLEKDAAIMSDLGYKSEDILSMKIRTTLLKMAAEQNLSLKEIDMIFRFYYFDFLEKAESLPVSCSEVELRKVFEANMNQVSNTVQNPVHVWGLIGNNFELYL